MVGLGSVTQKPGAKDDLEVGTEREAAPHPHPGPQTCPGLRGVGAVHGAVWSRKALREATETKLQGGCVPGAELPGGTLCPRFSVAAGPLAPALTAAPGLPPLPLPRPRPALLWV